MLYRPAGYYLNVTTWENDGDNYRTVSAHYTSEADVRGAIEICKLFRSKNSHPNPGIGNATQNDFSEIIDGLYDFIKKNPGVLTVTAEEIEDDEGDGTLLVYRLLGSIPKLGLVGDFDWFYTRVFERFTVEYFPEDVFCDDLTEQFA